MKKVRNRWLFIAFFVAVIILSSIGQVFALTKEVPNTQVRRIVVFDNSLTDEGHKERIIEQSGAKKLKNLHLINAAVVSVGPNEEKSL